MRIMIHTKINKLKVYIKNMESKYNNRKEEDKIKMLTNQSISHQGTS